MSNLNILQQLQYRFHLLLTLKNKNLLTILIYFIILILFIYTNDTNNAFCMTNDNSSEGSAEIQSVSDVSSIFEYDDAYFEHSIAQHIEHATEKFSRQFNSDTIDPVERGLGPIFEYLKTDNSYYINDLNTFDSLSVREKINTLQHAYFSESIEKSVVHDALDKQTDQLFKRHNSLLEAKGTIRNLTQENLELKNQIDELQRQLTENLRR